MGGFQYQTADIVAGTVLVVERIQSQNFVTNVSGWSINADGTAEFLNITIRGVVIVGNPNGQHVIIGGSDAPNGIAFYTGEPDETFPGVIQPDSDSSSLTVSYSSPLVIGRAGSTMELSTGRGPTDDDVMSLGSQSVNISGEKDLGLFSGGTSISMEDDGSGRLVSIDAPRIYLFDSAISNSAGAVMVDGDLFRIGENWHTVGQPGEPAFKGNWSVQAAGFTCGFTKDATGRVQLRGRVQETVASSTIIYTLPAGYRPSQSLSWLVKSNNDATSGSWVSVSSVGDVSVIGNLAGGRVQTILDAISFPTL